MSDWNTFKQAMTRRAFLGNTSQGVGAVALASLLGEGGRTCSDRAL